MKSVPFLALFGAVLVSPHVSVNAALYTSWACLATVIVALVIDHFTKEPK